MVDMKEQSREYRPYRIVTPGDHIQEMIDERGWTQVELARRMKRPVQAVNEFINGKRAITAETALQLEEVLSLSAQTWLSFESSYRLALARNERPRKDIEAKVFRAFVSHFDEAADPWVALRGFIEDISVYGPPSQVISSTCAVIDAGKIVITTTSDEEMIDRFKKITNGIDLALIA